MKEDSGNIILPTNKFANTDQNDENLIGYRAKIEDVNYKIISRLAKVCIFCFIFMMIEFIGGWIAGSLAIMTDAAHLLSDLSGFLISMVSLFIALRPADKRLTYGYHRAEVIGALSSVLIIWCLTAWLIIEAIQRIYNPQPITGLLMLGIAVCGLSFNLIMSKILTSEKIPNAFEDGMGVNNNDEMETDLENLQTQLNEPLLNRVENGDVQISENKKKLDENENLIMRATALHILGDIVQSVGVVIASSIIYLFQDSYPRIVMIDPLCTFVFALIVMYTSIPVTRDCINVLMEASPPGIEINQLANDIVRAEGVVNVHDFHVWCISIGKPSISLHILSTNPQKTLEQVTRACNKHGIYHTTIQVEDDTQKHRPSFMKCNHTYDNTIHY
jgi:solute carrier family 30 (zinc transporter), member 2